MAEDAATLRQELGGGLFLSSMMGITDGAFCARTLKGKHGIAMVQTGAYLAEPTATDEDQGADARCFLPPDPEACVAWPDKWADPPLILPIPRVELNRCTFCDISKIQCS